MKPVSSGDQTLICPVCGTDNPSSFVSCQTCGSSLMNALVKAGKPVAAILPSSNQLKASTTLHDGRYLLIDVIGQGSFGITYRAMDAQVQRYVAIKEFFPDGQVSRDANGDIVPNAEFVRDFERGKLDFGTEAAKLRAFRNSSIVKVYDNFVERNTAYLVMEFVDGETLEDRIASGKLLGEQEARKLLYFLLEALIEVHSKGILHLDIKPANIVLTEDRPKLIDFGTARRVIRSQATRVTNRVLTPAYAPLEQ